MQSRLRGYILANNETRLLSLLHLLGAASLRMDEALCPKDYPHLQCEVEQGIQFARSNLN